MLWLSVVFRRILPTAFIWCWERCAAFQVYTQQVAINNRNHAWDDVAALDDPYVLSALMWSWLEHLEEPAIGESDVKKIVNGFQSEARQELESKEAVTGQFEKALASLDERVRQSLLICYVCC